MRTFARIVLVAVAALGSTGADAATDPGLPGPFTAGVVTQGIPVPSGATLSTDIHFPALGSSVDPAAGECPLIVFGHGFSGNKGAHVDQGRHLATRGYITLIPNMAGFSDHSRNADDLVSLIDWALAENQDPASWLYGRVDANAIGSTGHSAGGLSSLVAAARDPRIGACAPMDPVDNNDLGVGEVPNIASPVAITYSEDSSCNAFGSSLVLYDACVPIKRGIKIVGANHCDPLAPSNFGCELVCGGANATRQETYVRLVTGWFEFWLRCDATYHEWVYGQRIQDEVAAGRLTYEADPDPGPIDPCPPGTPPGEVQGLRVTRTATDVLLTWQDVVANPAVDGYRAYRSVVLPFDHGLVVDAPATNSGADVNAIGAGDLFFYQVRAFNAAGEGP